MWRPSHLMKPGNQNYASIVNYSFKERVYHFLVTYGHHRIMYKKFGFDTQHMVWIPRWGWGKIQLDKAKESVKEYDNIDWDGEETVYYKNNNE